MSDRLARRQQLQSEVTVLRHTLGGHVTLTKTTEGPLAPFPIHVCMKIDKPKTCDHYDIDHLLVNLKIWEEDDGFSCRIHVANENLPASLKESIQSRLKEYIDSYHPCESAPIGLLSLAEFSRDSYGSLLCLRKEVLEHYEVADQSTGRSIRRIAIINNNTNIHIDTSVPERAGEAGKSLQIEAEVLNRLEQDTGYLSKVYGMHFRCVPARTSYVRIQKSDKMMTEFLHSKVGIGHDVPYPAIQHAIFHLTVSVLPSSPRWRDILPSDTSNPRLVMHIYIGENFPKKSSVMCRIQFEDDSMFPDECSAILLAFEKIILLNAFSGIKVDVELRDIVKYCVNHADEAMVEAIEIWEEAHATKDSICKKSVMLPEGLEPESSVRFIASLQGLQMDGIDAMSLHNVEVEAVCSRCRSRYVFKERKLDMRWNTVTMTCETCHQEMALSVQVRIIHCSSNMACILACTGCLPMDLLPCSSFEVQCQCSETSMMKDQFHQGRWNEKHCRACHTKEAYRFDRVLFQELKRHPEASLKRLKGIIRPATSEKTRSKYDPDTTLTLGQPLPETGTCIHYHHSHRWLRFPCCGRRYPCDLCHEELTDGHEMQWANRMVCGYCSLEQRVDSRCSGCSKKLTTSASRPEGKNTCFWEGGTGQRNKKRLSKKDPHKFRNSKAKTISRKAAAKDAKH